MSKVSKLIKNPTLFFSDFFAKRAGKPTAKQTVAKKAISKNSVANIDLSHVNFYRPIHFILHSGESVNGGANHLNLWIPTLAEANVNFVVLVRNPAFYNWVKSEFPWLSIAFARRQIDVEEFIDLLPNTKYVLYPSSTGNNIHLNRYNHLEHIFIGHGDSDKAASAHKALRLYDQIWTAGEAHIDRFKNSDFDTNHMKFLKVGRPNLSDVLLKNQDDWQERMNLSILYLPTWEGVMEEANYSSTHISGLLIKTVQQTLDSYLTVKYHPFTGNRNTSLSRVNEQTKELARIESLDVNVESAATGIDKLVSQHNIFICDISAVVTECLAANAPIFVYIPSDRTINITASNMTYEDYCYTFSSIPELLEKLEIVISGDDYLSSKRKAAIDYFLGREETLDKKFIKQLQNIAENKGLEYVPRLFKDL